VNFIRGDRSSEGAASPAYRKRDGIIGDIVNSTPVFVKDGNVEPYTTLPNIGDAYGTFLTEKAKRVGVLYVGGNGGMLHGFRDTKGIPAASAATDGTEVFAYVPRAGYPYLTKLTEQDYGGLINYHRFFVDGPLSERDAYVRAPGATAASWRNYLVGSMGAGGRAVFALDVTDPTALGASTIRWEIASDTHPELGYIAAPIQVGVVDDGSTNGKWVAIFGNGYVADDEATAYLFVVGLQDGSVTKLQISTKKANGLGGVSLKRNSFGQIESLYAGRPAGQPVEAGLEQGQPAHSSWPTPAKAIFEAPSKQPIVQPPLIKPHADGDWVVFGTGRLLTLGDADAVRPAGPVWPAPEDYRHTGCHGQAERPGRADDRNLHRCGRLAVLST
jgi:type IV pilus assembly protein PilY1